MTSQERLELRDNIKFCMELGETPKYTYKKLQRTRGENAVSRALVFKWFRRFSEGRKSLEDDEGRGRGSSVKPSDVMSIEGIIKEDARVTVREISQTDETWLYLRDPESKPQSAVWRQAESPPQVLNRDLIRVLRKKRSDIPVERFILHHDNASLHTAASTQLTIGVIGFELLPHPPYSPDPGPFDF
ncbi:protein GVQW3-like [Ruditapes philippinarum]|uniref:protein GVQW3-like n=1 Tax=Ruditapes philippinarum TaxID=129788 RepID=UPI00295AB58F|nr:protein GVQW3-like [Ruditapes philippinarum]